MAKKDGHGHGPYAMMAMTAVPAAMERITSTWLRIIKSDSGYL